MFGSTSLSSKSSFLASQSIAVRPLVSLAPKKAFVSIEAAHKKGAGSTKNGRDSNSQRRGVKVYGAQPVKAGGIIIRQQGSTVRPRWLAQAMLPFGGCCIKSALTLYRCFYISG